MKGPTDTHTEEEVVALRLGWVIGAITDRLLHHVPAATRLVEPASEPLTCPDCGLTATRIGEIHITAQLALAAQEPKP